MEYDCEVTCGHLICKPLFELQPLLCYRRSYSLLWTCRNLCFEILLNSRDKLVPESQLWYDAVVRVWKLIINSPNKRDLANWKLWCWSTCILVSIQYQHTSLYHLCFVVYYCLVKFQGRMYWEVNRISEIYFYQTTNASATFTLKTETVRSSGTQIITYQFTWWHCSYLTKLSVAMIL